MAQKFKVRAKTNLQYLQLYSTNGLHNYYNLIIGKHDYSANYEDQALTLTFFGFWKIFTRMQALTKTFLPDKSS